MRLDPAIFALICGTALLIGAGIGWLLCTLKKRSWEIVHEVGDIEVECLTPTRIRVTLLQPPDLIPLEWYDTRYSVCSRAGAEPVLPDSNG